MVSACVHSAQKKHCQWKNVEICESNLCSLVGILIFFACFESEVFHMLEMGKRKIEGDLPAG